MVGSALIFAARVTFQKNYIKIKTFDCISFFDCYQWAGNKLILNLLLECVGKDVVCDDAFSSANCCKPGLSCKMRYEKNILCPFQLFEYWDKTIINQIKYQDFQLYLF